MAIVAVNITNGSGSGTSGTTASVSPVANKLYLLLVKNNKGSTPTPTTPTVTGASMTWTQIATVKTGADYRLTLFRSLNASPGSGALTIDFAGDSQDGIIWSLEEFSGIVTTGTNGADAIVQSATVDETAQSGTVTVTLNAFGDLLNAAYGGYLTSQSAGFTEGIGYTGLFSTTTFFSQYKAASDTSVESTFTPITSEALGIAAEIKIAPVVITSEDDRAFFM